MRKIILAIVLLMIARTKVFAEIDVSHIVLLNRSQQEMLRQMVNNDPRARNLWHMLKQEADLVLMLSPQPQGTLRYAGLSRDDDDRIETEMALYDMDCLGILYYSIICSDRDTGYIGQAKKFIKAWTTEYVPTGNPENESKLEPLFHCYFLIKQYFSIEEQEAIENWMIDIAEMEKRNDNLPMDGSEAQRIKNIGTLGYLLNEPEYVKYSVSAFKRYVEVSLYPDGTSYELSQSNILENHVTMLEALVSFGITFRQFEGSETRLDVYSYQSPNGSSVKRSVEYVEPYAKGKLKHMEQYDRDEMVESTMSYGFEDANSSREWFNPAAANTLMQLASFFDKSDTKIIQSKSENRHYETWLGLMVRVAAGENNTRLSLR
ncbi:MAG: alginate lyase family protein [Bacteroidales bacterium]|nr:alginate lyase family protein [Bacteroidales bacterium]